MYCAETRVPAIHGTFMSIRISSALCSFSSYTIINLFNDFFLCAYWLIICQWRVFFLDICQLHCMYSVATLYFCRYNCEFSANRYITCTLFTMLSILYYSRRLSVNIVCRFYFFVQEHCYCSLLLVNVQLNLPCGTEPKQSS